MEPTNLGKARSFWEKPEGTTGMIFAVGGGSIALYALYHALPYLVTLLDNALHATIAGCVLFAVIYVLCDKRFQTLTSFAYQSLMRKITSIFVTVDALGIIKNYIRDMEKNLAKMMDQMSNLKGQIAALARQMNENARNIDTCFQMGKQAEKVGNKNQVTVQTRQAGRLQESNDKLKVLSEKLEILYRVLFKMSETAELVIVDTKQDVECKEREWKAVSAGNAAMRSAMSIMRGDVDKKALFEQSLEFLIEDIGSKVGEMDQFMDISRKITEQIDLENGVFEAKGLEALEAWEQQIDSGSLLKPVDKKAILRDSANPKKVLKLGELSKDEEASYVRLLRKK